LSSVRSSRRVGLSSVRLVAGWRRSRCAACEVVSRSTPCVSASFSIRRCHGDAEISPRLATSRDATSYFRFRCCCWTVSFFRRHLCCSSAVMSYLRGKKKRNKESMNCHKHSHINVNVTKYDACTMNIMCLRTSLLLAYIL